MSSYILSRRAESDIEDILTYTLEIWGFRRAKSYKDGLENCLHMLAKKPNIGQEADLVLADLKRFPYKSHMIFYLVRTDDIFIVRVLHQRMDYPSYLDE